MPVIKFNLIFEYLGSARFKPKKSEGATSLNQIDIQLFATLISAKMIRIAPKKNFC